MTNQFLIKETMQAMRGLLPDEIDALQTGIYAGVQLLGYYKKGDTPAPIIYYLAPVTPDPGPDDGGSVVEVQGIKLEHEFKDNVVNLEYFGAHGDGLTDDTTYINKCLEYCRHKKIIIKGGAIDGYLIKNNIIAYNSVEFSRLVFTNNVFFDIKSNNLPQVLPLSGLSGLNENSTVINGLPISAVGKYCRIKTNQILTERWNNNEIQYYYKNTAFKLINSDGLISPSLDTTFLTDQGTIEILDEEDAINITINIVDSDGVGTSINGGLRCYRDSTKISINQITSITNFQTLVAIVANNCSFEGVINKAEYPGLGYGISLGLCCDIYISKVKAYNCRTELDGRHAGNVFINNCSFNKAGTHWGNNYVFSDCDLGIVSWAGKDLTVDGGSIKQYINLRGDVSLSKGELNCNNIKHYGNTFLTQSGQNGNIYSLPRKVFDIIKIRNINSYNEVQQFINFPISINVFDPPKVLIIRDVLISNSNNIIIVNIPLDQSVVSSSVRRINISNIITLNNINVTVQIRGFTLDSPRGYNISIDKISNLITNIDANAYDELNIKDCNVIRVSRINASTRKGNIVLTNSRLIPDGSIGVLFNTESRKEFINCVFTGTFYNGGINGVVLRVISSAAELGAVDWPGQLIYYVNPILYMEQSSTTNNRLTNEA